MKLKIDQELKNLIPPLTFEDRRGLEENIKANGCETPITVWDGTIIDGHNRYDICVTNGIPFEIKELSFADKDDAKVWMIKHELEWKGRKITPYIRTTLALKMESIITEKAKAKMIAGAKKTNEDILNKNNNSGVQISAPVIEVKTEKTRDIVAKAAGVSHDTISKVKLIEAKATPEQTKDLIDDKKSINKVYTEIKAKEEAEKPKPIIIESPDEIEEKYPSQCQIFTPKKADIKLIPVGCDGGYCELNEKWYSKEQISSLEE